MWSSNSGHEHEKGDNLYNVYDGIMMILSGCGHDLLNDLTGFFKYFRIICYGRIVPPVGR